MPRYPTKSWRSFQPESRATKVAVTSPVLGAGPRCRILGIDPGSQRTGFGIIDCDGPDYRCVVQGRIDVTGESFVERLHRIHDGVRALLARHAPDEIAVEKVFVNRNVDSALKLGQARGAALAALGSGVLVFEYAPRAVKLATVGFGGADKLQVAHMIRALLRLEEKLSADAADALAVALCHAHARRLAALEAGIGAARSGVRA
jgi:crossover junction endodeoxyribonuclease RuvC